MTKMKGLVLGLLATGSASGETMIKVQFESKGPTGNAPVAGVFHDGSFGNFATGSAASAGLETLAEVGNPALYLAEAGFNGGTNGAPFATGNTVDFIVTVDPVNTSFSYASMVPASNDWFIGNSSAVDVSSLVGGMNGTTLSWDVTRVYDAGTELEDFAFSPGNGMLGVTTPADLAGGTDQNGVVSLVTGPDPFAAFANPSPGFDSTAFDFTQPDTVLRTFTLTVVPEPSTAMMGLLAILPMLRRRR